VFLCGVGIVVFAVESSVHNGYILGLTLLLFGGDKSSLGIGYGFVFFAYALMRN